MNYESLSRLLCSEKATYRKRGREELEKLLKKDAYFQLVLNKHWWELLWNTIQWEVKEINHLSRKGQQQNNTAYMNAVFVKQVFRHGSSLANFTFVRSGQVIEHILSVLYDKAVDPRYKEEHKELIAELLGNARFSAFISEEDIISILNYMKHAIPARSVGSRVNMKLLRVFPQVLYHDLQGSSLVDVVLDWYMSLIANELDIDGGLATTIGLCSEVLIGVMDFHGIGFVPAIFSHAHVLLHQSVPVVSYQSAQGKDALLMFLIRFSDICRSLSGGHNFFVTEQYITTLRNIYTALTDGDSLRVLIFSNMYSSKLTRDFITMNDVNPIFDDPRIKLHIQATVAVGNMLMRFLESIKTNIGYSFSPFTIIKSRFEDSFSLMGFPLHFISHKAEAKYSANMRSYNAPVVSGYVAGAQMLIPVLFLLCGYARDTVTESERASQKQDAALVIDLVRLSNIALVHMQRTTPLDSQLEAVLVWTLVELVVLTEPYSSCHYSSAIIADANSTWQTVSETIISLSQPFCHSSIGSVVLQFSPSSSPWVTIAVDGAIFLLKNLLLSKLLSSWNALDQFEVRLWKTMPFLDPLSTDSPHLFGLLSVLLDVSKKDIPDSLGEAIRRRSAEDITYHILSEACESFPILRVVKFVFSWIDGLQNLNFSLHTGARLARWPFLCSGVCDSFGRIICLLLGVPQATITSHPLATSSAISCANSKFWLFGKYAGIAAIIDDTPEYAQCASAAIIGSKCENRENYVSNKDKLGTIFNYPDRRNLAEHLIKFLVAYISIIIENAPCRDEKIEAVMAWAISAVFTASFASVVVHGCKDISERTCLLVASAWNCIGVIFKVVGLKFRLGTCKDTDTEDILNLLDKVMQILGKTNDFEDEINVSNSRDGCYSNVLIFINDFRDDLIARRLKSRGIESSFFTMNNEYFEENGPQPKLLASAPSLSDDFMDDEPITSPISKSVDCLDIDNVLSETIIRLVLSGEQQRILQISCRCLMHTKPTGSTIVSIQNAMCASITFQKFSKSDFKNDAARATVGSVYVPSEIWLILAQSIAEVHPVSDTFALLLNSWDKDWAGLGFCFVLQVLHRIMRNPTFFVEKQTFASSDSFDMMNNSADIVFAEHGSISTFPNLFWQIRALQIACSRYIFCTNPVKFKEKYAKYMLSGLTDRDFRVRIVAASNIETLFLKFRKNHFAIYKSMTSGISTWLFAIDSYSNAKTICPNKCLEILYDIHMKTATSVIAMLGIACSGINLLRTALRDMIILCAMIPFQDLFQNTVAASWLKGTLSTLRTLCALKISQFCGYLDTPRMFFDHERQFFNDWLSNNITQVLVPGPYKLEDYPFSLSGFTSLHEFVRHSTNVCVPAICAVSPPESRWALLQKFSNVYGIGFHDTGIASLILDSIPSIKAATVYQRHCSSASESDIEYVESFVGRVIDGSERKKRESSTVVYTILELLSAALYDIGNVNVGLNDSDDIQVDENTRCDLALAISEILRDSKYPLSMWNINITDIVALISCRLFESRSLQTQRRICEIVVLIINIYLPKKKSGCFLKIGRALGAEQHKSGEFLVILQHLCSKLIRKPSRCPPIFSIAVMKHFLERTLDNIEDVTLSEELGQNIATVQCDLFCDSICYLRSIKLGKGVNCDTTRNISASSRRNYDTYMFNNISEDLCDDIINSLNDMACKGLHWCRLHPEQFPVLLRLGAMIPRDSIFLASEELRFELDMLTDNVRNYDLKSAVESITSYSDHLLWGLPASLQTLWLAINGFAEMIVNDFCRHSFSLLATLPGETMRMALSLIRLSSEENDVGVEVFRYGIMHFLGKIGAPNILKVPHADLGLFSGAMKVDTYDSTNPDHVKLRIYLKIFKMLSHSNPRIIRQGQQMLQRLDVNSCLKGVLSAYHAIFGDQFLSCTFNLCKHAVLDSDISYIKEIRLLSSSDVLWDSREKDYSRWISQLASVLIFCCQSAGTSADSQKIDEERQEVASFLDLPFLSDISLSDPFIERLQDACAQSSTISEIILPLLLFKIVYADCRNNSNAARSILSAKLDQYFLSSDIPSRVRRLGCSCVWYGLRQEISAFLVPLNSQMRLSNRNLSRKRKLSETEVDVADSPFSLTYDLDTSKIIIAALSCGSVCTAAAIFEYFTDKDNNSMEKKQIHFAISKGLHDQDALYSTCNGIPSLAAQAILYAHSEKWPEAFSTYASLNLSRSIESRQCDNRHSVGNNFSVSVGEKIFNFPHADVSSAMKDYLLIGYQAERNLQQWNLTAKNENSKNIDQISNLCVRDMLRNEAETVIERITRCYDDDVYPAFYIHCGDETAYSSVIELIKLQSLTEIEEICELFDQNENDASTIVALNHTAYQMFNRWCSRMESMKGSISKGQKILEHRLKLVQAVLKAGKIDCLQGIKFMNQFNDLLDGPSSAHALSPMWYSLKASIEACCSTGIVGDLTRIECCLNEARLMWSKGLCDMALTSLNEFVLTRLVVLQQSFENLETSRTNTLLISRVKCDLSDALILCGEFLVSKKCSRSSADAANLLKDALTCADHPVQKIKAHNSLGKFKHQLYQSLRTRIDSAEWNQGRLLAATRKGELQQCMDELKVFTAKISRSKTDANVMEHRNRARHIRTLQKEIEMDTKEREIIESSVEALLLESLSSYGSVLSLSPEQNLSTVFLIISLWFDHADQETVNSIILQIFRSSPSVKFVPLTYQIFSRSKGDESNSVFSRVLGEVILKLCKDHPHHTLPQLFAIANEKSDAGKSKINSDGSSQGSLPMAAANTILSQLSRVDPSFSRLVSSMSLLLEEYIRIAFFPIDTMVKANRITNIPFSEISGNLQLNPFDKFFEQVRKTGPSSLSSRTKYASILGDGTPAVLTSNVPLRPDCDYRDIVRVLRFKENFSITETGLSRPKIIVCEGSNGIFYKQLVKGGDDMRQDAVMEQVFDHVNAMLQLDKETDDRRLSIRTYKIIPLTPQAGVIEWVNSTVQFGHYLTDRQYGAHGRYHPEDLSHTECRRIMADNVKENEAVLTSKSQPLFSQPLSKEEVFSNICTKFRPVFRYFFLENYHDPVTWMTRRTSYTRSVAASSMLGYILGIGDRHSQNILIDLLSAEVVHIDFGIMFEQGKVLGTPETVPFRLTRDIVDGMGISGCEGTYRRCCEEVLRVLRENYSQILTILEVVIHDPLYKWTLSPMQARKKQNDDLDLKSDALIISRNLIVESNGSSSKDAAKRTLLRIKNKLQGCDDPAGDILSVKGQVSMLINEASSVTNLSRLFAGWAPWL